METAVKPLLLLFVILYGSLVFVGRTLIVWRKTKRFPITYGNSDSAHDFLGRVFKIVVALYAFSTTVYLVQAIPAASTLYSYFMPVTLLEKPQIQLLGLLLAYTSMLWTIIAQSQMGQAWRIGIDSSGRTEVVHRGLFKISRHPIYFGVMMSALSLFLIMPNALNLILFLITALTLSVQARLEEEYLTELYGEEYIGYRSVTPRWF